MNIRDYFCETQMTEDKNNIPPQYKMMQDQIPEM